MTRHYRYVILLLLGCVYQQSTAAIGGAVVRLDAGQIEGDSEEGIMVFKGIPYAAPPVGRLRWQPPQPPAKWNEVRSAKTYGAVCMQTVRQDNGLGVQPPSEDCLTLNVWTPAIRPSKPLPVMFWIHGGGFVTGSGTAALYDGRNLARQGVVLVTINYRLGRLGFFAHPLLSREAGDEPQANYGMMDMIAALAWVKRNIAAFGGDSNNVTIFGESAGGAAVNRLMISPPAHGLFHKAIAQSGAGRETPRQLTQINAKGWPSALDDGEDFIRTLGVPAADVAALRAIPAETIVAAGDPSAFKGGGPVIDGKLLMMSAADAFRQGSESQIPYLVGFNSIEVPSTRDNFEANLAATTPLDQRSREGIVKAYGDEAEFIRSVVGDINFAEPARFLAGLHASRNAPTYLYRYSVVSRSMRAILKGTPHAQERQYVFNNLGASPWKTDENDARQAEITSAYWVAFARTGDPNGDGRPRWPSYTAAGDRLMDFTNEGPMVKQTPQPERLDAIAAHYTSAK
jgi:para-nitrobenzyl esterase